MVLVTKLTQRLGITHPIIQGAFVYLASSNNSLLEIVTNVNNNIDSS